MHITDCSGDLFSKCAVCDKFNAARFLHATLICPFVILKLKESARLYTLSRAGKEAEAEASYIVYIFCFQPWQTLKCYPCMTGSKKIVFGLGWQSQRDVKVGGMSSPSFILHSEVKALWVTMKAQDTVVHSRVNRNQFLCSFLFTNKQTKVIL